MKRKDITFPSPDGGAFPGQWPYGVDFSDEETQLVLAINIPGDGEIKYGLNWIGPIELTEESAMLLVKWGSNATYVHGGYVHLFPTNGNALAQLKEEVEGIEELFDEDEEG